MDTLKKIMYLGIGITALTKQKAEKLVKDMKKEQHFSEKEGKKMVNELLKHASKSHKQMQKIVKDQVDKTLGTLGLATKADINRLQKQLSKKKKMPTSKKRKK